MGMFKDLKKKLSKGLKESGDFLSKPATGGYDVVKSILDEPFVKTVSEPYRDSANMVKPAARKLLSLGNDYLQSTDEMYGSPSRVVNKAADYQEKAIIEGFPLLAKPTMKVLDKIDDPVLGGATLLFSDVTQNDQGDLSSKFSFGNFIDSDTYTGKRIDRNVNTITDAKGIERGNGFVNRLKFTAKVESEAGDLWDTSNLPTGIKMAGWILGDPTTYIPMGAVGKIGKAGKVLGLAEDSKAYKAGAALKPLAGLIEGFDSPKQLAAFTAGASVASEYASHTDNKWDDLVAPIAGGTLGTAKFGNIRKLADEAKRMGMVTQVGRSKKSLEEYSIIPFSSKQMRNNTNIDSIIDAGTHFEVDIGDGYKWKIEKGEPTNDPNLGLFKKKKRHEESIQAPQAPQNPQNPFNNVLNNILSKLESEDAVMILPDKARNKMEAYGTFIKWLDNNTIQKSRRTGIKSGFATTMRGKRLFFHTTPEGVFDLPDAAQVIYRTGQTQGPGVYLSADPIHSADWYGRGRKPKTFAVEVVDDARIMNMQLTPHEEDMKSWRAVIKDLTSNISTSKLSGTKQYVDDFYKSLNDIRVLDDSNFVASDVKNSLGTFTYDDGSSLPINIGYNFSDKRREVQGFLNEPIDNTGLTGWDIIDHFQVLHKSLTSYKENAEIFVESTFGENYISYLLDDFSIMLKRESNKPWELYINFPDGERSRMKPGDIKSAISSSIERSGDYSPRYMNKLDQMLQDPRITNFEIRNWLHDALPEEYTHSYAYTTFKKNLESGNADTVMTAINDSMAKNGIDGFLFLSSADRDTLVALNTHKFSTVMTFEDTQLKSISDVKTAKELVRKVLSSSSLAQAYRANEIPPNGVKDLKISSGIILASTGLNQQDIYSFRTLLTDMVTDYKKHPATFPMQQMSARFNVESKLNGINSQIVEMYFDIQKYNDTYPADSTLKVFATLLDKYGRPSKTITLNNIMPRNTDFNFLAALSSDLINKPLFRGKVKSYARNPKNNIMAAIEERSGKPDYSWLEKAPDDELIKAAYDDETVKWTADYHRLNKTRSTDPSLSLEERKTYRTIYNSNIVMEELNRTYTNELRRVMEERGLTPPEREKLLLNNHVEIPREEPKALELTDIKARIEAIHEYIDSISDNTGGALRNIYTEFAIAKDAALDHADELLDWYEYLYSRKVSGEFSKGMNFVEFGKVRDDYLKLDLNEQYSPFFSLKRDITLMALGGLIGYVSSGGDTDAAISGAGLGFMSGGLVKNKGTAPWKSAIEIYTPISVDGEFAAEILDDPAFRHHTAEPGSYNKFIDPVSLKEEERAVTTYGDRDIRKYLGKFITPDVARNTPMGRLLTAHRRMMLRSRNIVDVTISGVIDKHAGRFGIRDITGKYGTIFQTDEAGIVNGLGVHWATVIGKFDEYESQLNPTQREFVKDIISLLDDVYTLRSANGIHKQSFSMRDGSIYVPRAVHSVDDIDIPRRTDAGRTRLYEMIEEGISNGVDYRDIRETIRLYAVEAYDDIANKQLADELMRLSVVADELISPAIKQNYENKFIEFERSKEALSQARRSNSRLRSADSQRIFDDALESHDALINEFENAKSQYRRAKDAIKAGEGGTASGSMFGSRDGRVRVREWTNAFLGSDRLFKEEDYKLLVEQLGLRGVLPTINKGNPVSSFFRVQGNVARWVAAGFDFAFPMTHAIPILFYNPKVWVNASAQHFAGAVDPKLRDEYIANNLSAIQEMAKYGVDPSDPETFAAIIHGGEVPSTVLKLTGGRGKPVVNQVFKQSFGRFNSGLNMGLTVARTELWKSMSPNWEDKRQLASFINKLTGGIDSQMLGTSKTQRDFESTWMAFSPRLTRSTIALAERALNPVAWNQEARAAKRQLATMMAATVAFFTVVQMIRNYSDFTEDFDGAWKKHVLPSLNPLGGKEFLSMKIGDTWYGYGGQFRSLAQLIAGVAVDYDKLASTSSFDNPLLKYYRSRGAPAVDSATTIIEGVTGANANPYEEINGPIDIFSELAFSNIPFTIQGYLEGESVPSTLASSVGTRTSRETSREYLDSKAKEIYGKPLKELNREQKSQFYKAYPPEIKRDDNVSKYFTQVNKENEDWTKDILAYGKLVGNSKTKTDFREFYSKRTAERYSRIEGIRSSFSILPADVPGFTGSVLDYLNSKELQPEDKAVQDWYSLSSKFTDETTGDFDFDGFEKARVNFLKGLDPGIREYVINNTKSEPISPLVGEMKDAQLASQEYWNANNDLWKARRDANAHPIYALFANYDEYSTWVDSFAKENNMTRNMALNFINKRIPETKKFTDASNEYKRLIRVFDPELDSAMADWYNIEPANRIGHAAQGVGVDEYSYESANAYAANPDLNNIQDAQAFSFRTSGLPRAQRRFEKEKSRSYQRRLSLQQR